MSVLADAANLQEDARIGSIFMLAYELAKMGATIPEDLLSEGISVAEHSEQKRWYLHDLLFLRALSRLCNGNYSAASADIDSAYSFRPDIDETKFRFDWLERRIGGVDLIRWPNLRYMQHVLLMKTGRFSYEDILGKLPADTSVLEIGANDGVKTDALYPFITSRNWSAILVEPVADSFARLTNNYAKHSFATLANVAITDKTGPVQIQRINPESMGVDGLDPAWAEGVSSISAKNLTCNYAKHLITETVHGMSFVDFAERFSIDKIDVLQIDTEGHDYKIFRQIDLDRYGVKVAHIESNHLPPVERLSMLLELEARGFVTDHDGYDITAARHHLIES